MVGIDGWLLMVDYDELWFKVMGWLWVMNGFWLVNGCLMVDYG